HTAVRFFRNPLTGSQNTKSSSLAPWVAAIMTGLSFRSISPERECTASAPCYGAPTPERGRRQHGSFRPVKRALDPINDELRGECGEQYSQQACNHDVAGAAQDAGKPVGKQKG